MGPPKEGITTAMIDELSAFLVDARCRRPRGELTYARQAEWEMSVKRLVQNHAATAEATTFKNAIKTLQELYHFQILRGRAQGLEEVDPVDLDAFLHGGTTSAEVDQQECPAPVGVARAEASQAAEGSRGATGDGGLAPAFVPFGGQDLGYVQGRGRQMDSSSGAVACGSGSPPVQAPESVNCPQDHPFDSALFLH